MHRMIPHCIPTITVVADMAAVLDAGGVDRAVIAGLSLGGFLSLLFYAAFPPKSQGADAAGTQGRATRARRPARSGISTPRRTPVLWRRGVPMGSCRSPEISAARHATLAGLPHVARGMLTQHDARVIESLPGIAVPTLLMVGAEDRPFLDGMRYMARKIEGSQHVVVASAGHAVNIDQPLAVNRTLDEFLARDSRRPRASLSRRISRVPRVADLFGSHGRFSAALTVLWRPRCRRRRSRRLRSAGRSRHRCPRCETAHEHRYIDRCGRADRRIQYQCISCGAELAGGGGDALAGTDIVCGERIADGQAQHIGQGGGTVGGSDVAVGPRCGAGARTGWRHRAEQFSIHLWGR